MTEETLRELLARVHERLSSSGTVDPEARDMLATVMRDIDSALWKGAGGDLGRDGTGARGSLDAPPVASVPVSPEARVAATAPRLEALAVRFEAEHPSLAQLLRQIGDLLGKAGI
jgi:hypothetical protein